MVRFWFICLFIHKYTESYDEMIFSEFTFMTKRIHPNSSCKNIICLVRENSLVQRLGRCNGVKGTPSFWCQQNGERKPVLSTTPSPNTPDPPIPITRTSDSYNTVTSHSSTSTQSAEETSEQERRYVCTNNETVYAMIADSPCSACWFRGLYPDGGKMRVFKTNKRRPIKLSAIAYMSATLRMYICSTELEGYIISSDKNGQNEEVHVTKVWCKALAVDDLNVIVFFIASLEKYVTARLTGDGYEVVKNMTYPGYDIDVYPITKTIYVANYKEIICFSYEGKHKETLVTDGKQIRALTLTPDGTSLYYGSIYNIVHLNLTTNEKTVVNLRLSFEWPGVRHLLYAYDSIIFSSAYQSYITVIDAKTLEFHRIMLEVHQSFLLFGTRNCKKIK